MDAGDEFRETLGRGDALALLAIASIRGEREEASGEANLTLPRQAYILRSLKHPLEVERLREIYGSAFVLIGAYSPRDARLDALARDISQSHHNLTAEPHRARAEALISRDEADQSNPLGQNVRETFPKADFFVDTSRPDEMNLALQRFVETLFGYSFHTPSRDEYAMFHAQAAALRSADMGRQVGAVITTTEGDVIAIGTNEVPKAGGGLYWPGDKNDGRNFVIGYDSSDRFKRIVLGDLLERLKASGWLTKERADQQTSDLLDLALTDDEANPAKGALLMNSIEYGRAVHAEMAAITDAARRGASIDRATLYTTTFPCHDCAKHIVSAGLRRVVYIEPYPKSLASELYPDSISFERIDGGDFVNFVPFVGIAPRLYIELFEKGERKGKDGRVVAWDALTSAPKLSESSLVYLARERSELFSLETALSKLGSQDRQVEEEREVEEARMAESSTE